MELFAISRYEDETDVDLLKSQYLTNIFDHLEYSRRVSYTKIYDKVSAHLTSFAQFKFSTSSTTTPLIYFGYDNLNNAVCSSFLGYIDFVADTINNYAFFSEKDFIELYCKYIEDNTIDGIYDKQKHANMLNNMIMLKAGFVGKM